MLKNEFVVISAHLSRVSASEYACHLNADGYASARHAAREAAAAAAGRRLQTSVVFAAVTAEEKGLLGSRYFANRASIPPGKLVANLNTDMFLPLFPLKSVVVQGLEESDLAADLKRVARPLGIEVLSDPEPERIAFVRSEIQLHQDRRAGALVEGRLYEGFTGTRARQALAHGAVSRAERRSRSTDRSKIRRGFRQDLSRGRRRGGQSHDAAAVEQRQLLQAVRQVNPQIPQIPQMRG